MSEALLEKDRIDATTTRWVTIGRGNRALDWFKGLTGGEGAVVEVSYQDANLPGRARRYLETEDYTAMGWDLANVFLEVKVRLPAESPPGFPTEPISWDCSALTR